MPDVLKDLSTARIERSKDCLREAKLLLDNGEYRGAANRAYYAAFHALRAVLALDDFDSKKHSGIISKFRETYIKTGRFTPAMSDTISSLFRIRSASDYDDFYIASKADVEAQYQRAEKLVAEIERYLATK